MRRLDNVRSDWLLEVIASGGQVVVLLTEQHGNSAMGSAYPTTELHSGLETLS